MTRQSLDPTVRVTVNGVIERLPRGKTLSWLLETMGERDVNLIVEKNGSFVYPQRYGSEVLEEGDTIEVINPDFGG